MKGRDLASLPPFGSRRRTRITPLPVRVVRCSAVNGLRPSQSTVHPGLVPVWDRHALVVDGCVLDGHPVRLILDERNHFLDRCFEAVFVVEVVMLAVLVEAVGDIETAHEA